MLSDKDQNELLDKWKAPKEMVEKFPYYVSGFDIEKRPVFVAEIGKWPVRQFVENGGEDLKNLDNHFKKFLRRVEIGPKAFFKESEMGASGSVVILDWDGFRLTQLIHEPTLQFFKSFSRISKNSRNSCVRNLFKCQRSCFPIHYLGETTFGECPRTNRDYGNPEECLDSKTVADD
ncbi:unnamed protein product [Allacma fusca]|uniref:Uncharacterized protein n=1 Tax=Allacma fusca TaxID=39272 RepID=A0A8J2PYB9_9HEXA|nr:unnamed protein product [Allacma fusca]